MSDPEPPYQLTYVFHGLWIPFLSLDHVERFDKHILLISFKESSLSFSMQKSDQYISWVAPELVLNVLDYLRFYSLLI